MTCDQLICHYCATSTKEHAGHTFDMVEPAAIKHRNELIEIIGPTDEMSASLTKAKKNIINMKSKIENQAKKIEKIIDRSYTEHLTKLNEHHQQLKKQLQDELSQKEIALTT